MKLPRRRPKPETLTTLQAIDILNRVRIAIEQDNHYEIFRLVGITDEIADQTQNARELYDIASVRISDIARIAKINIQVEP